MSPDSAEFNGYYVYEGWGSDSSSTSRSTDPYYCLLVQEVENEMIDEHSTNSEVRRIQEIARDLRDRLAVVQDDLDSTQRHIRCADEASEHNNREINRLIELQNALKKSNVRLSVELDQCKINGTKHALSAQRFREYFMVACLFIMLCVAHDIVF